MLNTMNRSRALCLVLRRVILVNLFRGPNTQQAQPGTSIFVFVYLYLLNFCICVFVFGQFFISIKISFPNQNRGFFRAIFAPMSHKKKETQTIPTSHFSNRNCVMRVEKNRLNQTNTLHISYELKVRLLTNNGFSDNCICPLLPISAHPLLRGN